MIKRILGAMILVPVIILATFWCVNFTGDVLTGKIDLIAFLIEHKLIISLIAAYFVIRWIHPFRKAN